MTIESEPDEEILRRLGERIARERLRLNLTQGALAEEAGVSRATVGRLESGESTQLQNLVRVLRALGLLDNLELLVPDPGVSPLELARRQGRPRQRASSTGRVDPVTPKGPWTWGEDR